MEGEGFKKKKLNLAALMLLALGAFLLLILFGILIFRYMVGLKSVEIRSQEVQEKREDEEEERFVSEYFERQYSVDSSDGSFLENDPFIDQCGGVPGGAVSFGTACIREE